MTLDSTEITTFKCRRHFDVTVTFALNSHPCATDKNSSWNLMGVGAWAGENEKSSGQAMWGVDPPTAVTRTAKLLTGSRCCSLALGYRDIHMHYKLTASHRCSTSLLPKGHSWPLTPPLLFLTDDWQVWNGGRHRPPTPTRHKLTLSPVSVYFNNSNHISNNHHFSVPD